VEPLPLFNGQMHIDQIEFEPSPVSKRGAIATASSKSGGIVIANSKRGAIASSESGGIATTSSTGMYATGRHVHRYGSHLPVARTVFCMLISEGGALFALYLASYITHCRCNIEWYTRC